MFHVAPYYVSHLIMCPVLTMKGVVKVQQILFCDDPSEYFFIFLYPAYDAIARVMSGIMTFNSSSIGLQCVPSCPRTTRE